MPFVPGVRVVVVDPLQQRDWEGPKSCSGVPVGDIGWGVPFFDPDSDSVLDQNFAFHCMKAIK